MERHPSTPRPDYVDKVLSEGLVYHVVEEDGKEVPYWAEDAAYSFDSSEVTYLEDVAEELHRMCLQAVEHVIENNRFAEFAIPEYAWPAIRRSWEAREPSLYGRFDFRWDGRTAAKLLEYNADTPTSLIESAVCQWTWKEEVQPELDQWNSLHDRLVERFRELRTEPDQFLHIGWVGDEWGEDATTCAYLSDVAHEAGWQVIGLTMDQIGWDGEQFLDADDRPIETMFKLYPWEWMFHEEFGEFALRPECRTQWLEPVWKALLSNKALLAILWELFRGHENLLPAYLDGPQELTDYVEKPLLGREGANVEIYRGGVLVGAQDGEYGEEGSVYQELAELPEFDGWHPVIGAWIVNDQSAGGGIRESRGLITDNQSKFQPHYLWAARPDADQIAYWLDEGRESAQSDDS